MNITKKHATKKWEVSIIALHNNGNTVYKVTRRLPEMTVAETKTFKTKEEAQNQFDEWLK